MLRFAVTKTTSPTEPFEIRPLFDRPVALPQVGVPSAAGM